MYILFIKRFLDIIISLCLLPFFIIVFIVVAPVLYLTDKGPIFYSAKRAGKLARSFKMYKFRSMYVNAPDLRNSDGSTYNGENDSRVTKFGAFLRKTSIDELPQILNLLKGDMSFVGPRPILSTKKYAEYDDVIKKRLSVKPGITGYSQAYYRNSITQKQKIEYDCFYVDNVSLGLDIKIILKTIDSVIRKKNIYIKK